jgi:peptidoglycan/xylan/chitin deacetylase (PgdA/CDA1 family)
MKLVIAVLAGIVLILAAGYVTVKISENAASPQISPAASPSAPGEADSAAAPSAEPEPAAKNAAEPEATPAPEPLTDSDYRSLRVYEAGEIMVIMYHGITDGPAPTQYQRSREDFRKDLQTLYDRGFRVIPLKDLIENNITAAAGFTPVVLTFDDGIDTSFSLVGREGGFAPAPGCGLQILWEFNEEHPDFGKSATFFINGDVDTFGGAGTLKDRLNFLVENGCDIGNHTFSHANLNELDADGIQKEIGLIDQLIRSMVPGYEPFAFSYPRGIRPDDALKPLALDGSYNGVNYHYETAVREGMSGASNIPNRLGYDPLNAPRVRGGEAENETTDLWGRLRFYEEHPEYRYISDGNPGTIVVPAMYADNVDANRLDGKIFIAYE